MQFRKVLLIILIQNPVIMSTRQEMFSTSFLLKNNVKGYLDKFKKLNISSTFKFKSKLNNHRAIKESTIYSPQKNYSPQELSQNAQQTYNKKIRTFRFDSLNFQQNYFNKVQSPKSNKNQFQKSKNNLKQFFPIFPQIQNKKIKSSKMNHISENQQQIKKSETPNTYQTQKIPSEKNRTIQNGFYQKMTKQFENLIKKQVLKTENQAILRQGHLKFDQTQAFFTTAQNHKKFGSTKKRKKRFQIQNDQVKQQNPIQRFFSIQGPQARSVSLVPASLKSQQMPILRLRLKQKSRYSYQKIQTDKLKKEIKNDEYANMVKGWDNQDYQNSLQVFEQNIEKQERVEHKYKSFKSNRLN